MEQALNRRAARLAVAETLVGLGLLAWSGVAAWQVSVIPVSPLYSKVGPTVFPTMAVAGLAILSAILLARGLRGGWQPAEEREGRLDLTALALIVAGLVANVLLIGPAGFTVSSTVMFVLVAAGFGSKAAPRNAAIGLVLALAAYFGFAGALGVNIGAGPVERAIEGALGLGA